jgi:hypothetical protein
LDVEVRDLNGVIWSGRLDVDVDGCSLHGWAECVIHTGRGGLNCLASGQCNLRVGFHSVVDFRDFDGVEGDAGDCRDVGRLEGDGQRDVGTGDRLARVEVLGALEGLGRIGWGARRSDLEHVRVELGVEHAR